MKKWTSFNWFMVSKTGCVANMNHSFLVNMCFPFFSPVLKCHFPRVWPFILKWVLEWNVKQTIVPRSKGVSITRCVTRSQWEIFLSSYISLQSSPYERRTEMFLIYSYESNFWATNFLLYYSKIFKSKNTDFMVPKHQKI